MKEAYYRVALGNLQFENYYFTYQANILLAVFTCEQVVAVLSEVA